METPIRVAEHFPCLSAHEPRKEVKEPLVPCGVSFPLFFPLVERKEVVEDRTRRQHSREHRERQRVAVRRGISSKKAEPFGRSVAPFLPMQRSVAQKQEAVGCAK
jgi:hypothetical protein